MYFVGADLARDDRRTSGLAVLDDAGRLLHVGSVHTDAEIVETLTPYTRRECLVAVNAPLVVRNATGNRPAEAALNKDFARFDAGVHPSNTSKPELAGTPRGAAVVAALGLDTNPRSRRARRAVEVNPKPATVALFRLGRALKYRNKPGRTLESLRSALGALMTHVEGLEKAEPALDLGGTGWEALVEAVATATTKADLRVVEDQVDAVVCAYVAMFAVRRRADTVTYGDLETGSILTPRLPEDLVPSPRGDRDGGPVEPAGEGRVAAAVREYVARQPEILTAGQGWTDLVTGILDEGGINYLTVTGRVKSVDSFAAKAAREADGAPLYADPLREITDQIGVRVITCVLSDVATVAGLLAEQVDVRDDRDLGRETASQGRFGYASRHVLVALDPDRAANPAYEHLRGTVAAVQIRTVLQHAWAEFEHDIRYKGTVPADHAREFDRRFTLAAGLLELADREFSAIREKLQAGPVDTSEADDPRIEPRDLAAFLAGQYTDAGWSRTDHYAWISGLLLELGITSLDELSEVLRPVNRLDLVARMDYRYPPGAVRRLDDALLAAFGERYLGLHGNAHRVPLLTARLERLSGD